ncbi:MAG: HlyD family efflux transporter periplasmic adaptor subunit [Planctomycetota bacterium]
MEFETSRASYEVASQRLALMKSGSRPEEIQMAEARLEQAKSDLSRLENGARPEEIAAQRATVRATAANVERLKTQFKETEILAPLDSVVETLDLQPGDLVKPGETIAILNLKNKPWIRCYTPEAFLGKMKVGLEVQISVDAYPEKRFPGKIRWISSLSEFTPRNIQTTAKRMEMVFEMKVDILQDGEKVRAGMFADIHFPEF